MPAHRLFDQINPRRSWARLRSGVVSVGLCLAAATSTAALVNYNETTDGDLGDDTSPLTILELGVGTNTVAGTFHLLPTAADFDNFGFRVPAGARLRQVTVTLTDRLDGVDSSTWVLFVGQVAGAGDLIDELRPASPGSDSFDGLLEAGLYHLFHATFSSNSPASADYSFALVVEEQAAPGVPEPASAALLAVAAAAGLAERRRRSPLRRGTAAI